MNEIDQAPVLHALQSYMDNHRLQLGVGLRCGVFGNFVLWRHYPCSTLSEAPIKGPYSTLMDLAEYIRDHYCPSCIKAIDAMWAE